MKWQLQPGFSAGEIEWPTPGRFQTSTIVDYGYENAVLLIVPMHAEASVATQQAAHLNASLKLLVCSQEMCIPGKAELSLALPIKSQPPPPDARTADLFAATRKSLPSPVPAKWRFSVADAKDSFVLTANLGRQVAQAVFFPLIELQIENAVPEKLATTATGFRMTLRKSDQLQKPIERLKGVLVLSADRSHADPSHADRSYVIDVPISKTGR